MFWETIDLFRKLAITSLPILIHPGTTAQVITGIFHINRFFTIGKKMCTVRGMTVLRLAGTCNRLAPRSCIDLRMWLLDEFILFLSPYCRVIICLHRVYVGRVSQVSHLSLRQCQ